MNKYIISLIVCSFLAVGMVFAQVDVAGQVAATEQAIQNAETITTEDLGIKDPGMLPTNPFYFFKEFGRVVRMTFTFNSISKTELERKIVNEKAAEAKKVEESRPNDEAAITKALENYQNAQENLKARLENLQQTSQNPNVDTLLNKVLENSINHEKVFDDIASKFQDNSNVQNLVGAVKEKTEESIAAAATKDTPADFSAKFEKALIQSKGSELKHIRSLEIIDRVEQKLPEINQVTMDQLRQDFSQKFQSDVQNFENKTNSAAVQSVLEQIPGDLARRSVIIDEVINTASAPVAATLDKANKGLEKIYEGGANITEKAQEQINNATQVVEKLQALPAQTVPVAVTTKLEEAKKLLEQGKFGEAFGQARSVEVQARNAIRAVEDKTTITSDGAQKLIDELAAKINKYGELLNEKGITADKNPRAYDLLTKAKESLDLARQELVKNNIQAAKEHTDRVRDLLQKLYEVIGGGNFSTAPQSTSSESVKIAPTMPVNQPINLEQCISLKKDLENLNVLLKEEKISEQDYKLKYESIWKQLVNCSGQSNVPIEPIESEINKVCTQEYNPVCGNNGKTYSNECMAKISGVEIKYKGECGGSSSSGGTIPSTSVVCPQFVPTSPEVEKDCIAKGGKMITKINEQGCKMPPVCVFSEDQSNINYGSSGTPVPSIVVPPSTSISTSPCETKGTSCCKGDVCAGKLMTCLAGTVALFQGCDKTTCTPLWVCSQSNYPVQSGGVQVNP